MQRDEKSTPLETFAVLLYNDGLATAKQGRLEAAAESLAAAASVSCSHPEIPMAACKVYFALGQFEGAHQHIELADRYGAPAESVTRMRRAIEREQNIAANPTQSVVAESSESCRGSWIIAFCDWLEGAVYEFCHDLRESVVRG